MKPSEAAAIAAFSLTAALTVGTNVLRASYQSRIAREIVELLRHGTQHTPTPVTERDFEHLPEPVRRWLTFSRVAGTERPVTVRLKQTGEFRTAEGARWMPFTADEYFTTDPPGYVWRVKMRAAPFLSIDGYDRYFDGSASIDMRLLSVFPVARSSSAKLAQGALLRYLNEIMWFPAAALSWYIDWEPVDQNFARATIRWGGITASATFSFDGDGRLVNMTADRYNDQLDRVLPWSTPIDGYGEFDGLRLPSGGTGVWEYPNGDFSYIRLHVTDVEANKPFRFPTEDTPENDAERPVQNRPFGSQHAASPVLR